MITSLRGTLLEINPPTLVVECAGVGYEVWTPSSTFVNLSPIGSDIFLHTSQIIREDSQSLYGFINVNERKVFNMLLKISGIGAKSALALLSALDTSALATAVETNDVKTITRAPGIGRKSAERIIVELRDSNLLVIAPASNPLHTKAVEALIALGYNASTARTALGKISSKNLDLPELIKAALAELSK